MIVVLTSRCARLDGRRGARNRAMRAVAAPKRDPAEAP
jgi:putative resolvase